MFIAVENVLHKMVNLHVFNLYYLIILNYMFIVFKFCDQIQELSDSNLATIEIQLSQHEDSIFKLFVIT